MSDANAPSAHPTPSQATDLLAATSATAYFWGRVAGDGGLAEDCVTVRTADEAAADVLAAVVGLADGENGGGARAGDRSRGQIARESAHDASVVRHEDEHELRVFGPTAERASAAFGLPLDGQPGGYRFGAFADHRGALLRGMLEGCGTICFRESAGEVGVSFVHDDPRLLDTIRSHLEAAPPAVPADDRSETSSGGYWFGLADDADVPAFARWLYAGSDETGLYAPSRRRKLRRSVERASQSDAGSPVE